MPYTLLLADDSVTIQRVIELTFADEDVTVVAVSDGDQAIERLEASPPDIVLADIGMPGKNGYEVAQYIRKSPKLQHIPVVLLTGAFEPVDQARANDAGCDGVLAKPFEPQLVIGRVRELLARSHRAPDAGVAALGLAGPDAALPPIAARTTPVPDNIWAPPLAEPRLVTPFVDPPQDSSPAPRAELNDYFDRLDAAFSTLTSSAPAPAAAPAATFADPPVTPIETEIDWFGSKAAEAPSTEPWDVPPPAPEHAPFSDLPMSYASPQPETGFEAANAGPDERLAPIEESAPVAPEAYPAPVASETYPVPVPYQSHPAPATSESHPAPAAYGSRPAPPDSRRLELPLPHPPPLPSLPDAFAALLAAEQGDSAPAAAALWPAASSPAPAAPAEVSDALIEDVTRRVLERLSDTLVRDAVADLASQVAERLVREEIQRIRASIK